MVRGHALHLARIFNLGTRPGGNLLDVPPKKVPQTSQSAVSQVSLPAWRWKSWGAGPSVNPADLESRPVEAIGHAVGNQSSAFPHQIVVELKNVRQKPAIRPLVYL